MLFFLAATAVLIVITILLVHSLLRGYRYAAGRQDADIPDRPGLVLEAFWTLVPFGILAVLLVLTFQAI